MINPSSITHHTQLLNYLAERFNLQSYCEIGIQDPANNFDKIICPNKEGCDPDVSGKDIFKLTSDQYFAHIPEHIHHDLYFIDGLHTAEQVEKDFNNSLRCLNDGGFIVLHDTCPDEEQCATAERNTKKWFGDVYSFAMNLGRYNGLNFLTLDMDCGITICWKVREVTIPKETYKYSWADYVKGRWAL